MFEVFAVAKSYNSKLVELAETFRELEAELEQNQLPTNRNSREYIRWIQTSLNQILGIGLVVDGIMGPQTRNAIRRFQQQQGLVPDGIVGMKTEAADSAASASGGSAFGKGSVIAVN
ncbi:MAG TPA: hypothetical protein DCL61_19565, partial [Cyanobacteria bacterium UBA12227]|nr:hypothetical protein [Cyanobacteria bacterium UBA12227]